MRRDARPRVLIPILLLVVVATPIYNALDWPWRLAVPAAVVAMIARFIVSDDAPAPPDE
jgi:hypothetical protein